MARILITSGPTRQYLDPVRFISNASSGKMGAALAQAACVAGHQVVVVSGPVNVNYPAGVEVIEVTTTQEMLIAAQSQFPNCAGVISAAAPCDFAPVNVASEKIKKTAQRISMEFEQTVDILGTLGNQKTETQWLIGFALESAIEDAVANAVEKLKRKRCDLIVLNHASAIDSDENSIDIIDASGKSILSFSGSKQAAAAVIIDQIGQLLG